VDAVSVYLTREQIYALVTVANHSLIGVQINTDARYDTGVTCDIVDIDEPNRSRHFEISPEARLTETT
jgi:hypothetical protein